MCKEKGYTVITAPYEADAQLAWLSRENRVDAVITGKVLDFQSSGLSWLVNKKTCWLDQAPKIQLKTCKKRTPISSFSEQIVLSPNCKMTGNVKSSIFPESTA
jgi:5'-3' exonuclease